MLIELYYLFLDKFFKKYPKWAYGLECDICSMSFSTPKQHYDHVNKSKILKVLHHGEVPRIVKEDCKE